ncbi:MAG: thiamine-phosphate kinase [Actinomycetota bacterium]
MGAFSEDELISGIRRVLSGDSPGVVLGIGDDAAVVETGPGRLVLTTDILVEGVHFARREVSATDLGHKAITVNLSDIAAMAASPRFATVSLALSDDVELPWVVELYGGMRDACSEHAVSIVGGDLSAAGQIAISVTVAGEVAEGREIRRAGAIPGERIVVTGALGAAAGGLRLSRAHPSKTGGLVGTDWGRELLRAQARPTARIGEAQTLARAGATAMIDVSDGFARDLWRLCAESGVGARIELAKLPVSEWLAPLAEELGEDPVDLALHGGEDYELIATLDEKGVERAAAELRERFAVPLTQVGEIIDHGLEAADAHGRVTELQPKGWDHFG